VRDIIPQFMEIWLYFFDIIFKGVPDVLDRVQIRAVRWPVNCPDAVLFQPFRCTPIDVNTGIILDKKIPSFVVRSKTFFKNVTIRL
jgi:hypothetical protein